jgi:OmpA-OmpF porin, OOP family
MAQRHKIRTYYKNGMPESEGIIHSYPVFYDIKKLPKKFSESGIFEKKEKEWLYWYPNGQVRRVEHYKFIKDKNANDLPDGEWKYFNAQGIKYCTKYFRDGVLRNLKKEIYRDTHLTGSFTLHEGITDTVLTEQEFSVDNLVLNPGFDYFFYKPVSVVSDGHAKFEDWVPFWTAPGNYTPDYLSNLRSIDVLSSYYLFDFPLPEKYTYAGLGLYKDSVNYSEYLEGKLKEPLSSGKKYCLKITVALSSYSGFSADRLSFNFSREKIYVDESNEDSFQPQVTLPAKQVNSNQFITLCKWFVAQGGEQYLTTGRFCTRDMLKVKQRLNMKPTQFGIEKSAYYLIDSIEVHEITDTLECICNNSDINKETLDLTHQYENKLVETDLGKLKSGNQVILKDLNFEFDSYRLAYGADSVLKVLLSYLNTEPGINIQISGYTDDIGTEEYNQVLSVNRAKSVYNWLVSNGIDPCRLKYTGFGKSQPLYSGSDNTLRALNRRVAVKIITNDKREVIY